MNAKRMFSPILFTLISISLALTVPPARSQGKKPGPGNNPPPPVTKTKLEVKQGSGDFQSWVKSLTITTAGKITFRWMTDEPGVASAAWIVSDKPFSSGGPVVVAQAPQVIQSGPLNYLQQRGFASTFEINFAQFAPKTPPATALNYYVRIVTFDAQHKPKGVPSSAVRIRYQKPDADVKFDSYMGGPVPNPFAGAPKPTRLIVIYRNPFYAVLKPLVDHKNKTGMPAMLVNLELIKDYFPGGDEPEKIKRAIEYAHKNLDARYVLLAGDASLIPVRHRFVRQNTVKKENPGAWLDGTYNPSELYYSNLYRGHQKSGSSITHSGQLNLWDLNSDGKFNDQVWKQGAAASYNPDQVDGCPDIALGRVPAHTTQEMKVYVDKVIRYESGQMSGAGRGRYAFLIDKDYPGADGHSNQIEGEIAAMTPAENKFHVGLNYGPADPVPSPFEKGNADTIVGMTAKTWWISYLGHGYNQGWGGAGFDASKVQSTLFNKFQLPVVFSVGCDTGQFALSAPFGRYPDSSGKAHNFSPLPPPAGATKVTDMEIGAQVTLPMFVPTPGAYDFPNSRDRTFACAWLFKVPNGGGAIAFFGETVVMENDKGRELHRRVLRRYAQGDRILGDMWLNGQRQFWRDFVGSGDIFREPRVFLGIMTFFGDPSLRVQ